LIKIVILEENFKWHLEAFASELFKFSHFPSVIVGLINCNTLIIKVGLLLYYGCAKQPVFVSVFVEGGKVFVFLFK